MPLASITESVLPTFNLAPDTVVAVPIFTLSVPASTNNKLTLLSPSTLKSISAPASLMTNSVPLITVISLPSMRTLSISAEPVTVNIPVIPVVVNVVSPVTPNVVPTVALVVTFKLSKVAKPLDVNVPTTLVFPFNVVVPVTD